jgi:hypothetical protein
MAYYSVASDISVAKNKVGDSVEVDSGPFWLKSNCTRSK